MKNVCKSCVLAVLLAILLITSACNGKAPAEANQYFVHAQVYSGIGVPGDGNVVAIGLMQTIQYLLLVFRGDPSTFIMQSPTGNFLFAWSMQGNTWGFLGISADGTPVANILASFCGSNCANTLTFTGLVKSLEQNGWEYVTPTAVPACISGAFGSITAFAIRYGNLLYSPIPLFIIIPNSGYFANPFPIGKD
jgi:hypothetical protein